ncbi:MAG: SxtJ family membrane protein [Pseudomonadota bacterium]
MTVPGSHPAAPHPARLSDRAFGLAFAVVFALIALSGWVFFDGPIRWAAALAALFLAFALAAPGLLLPLNRLWGALARRLAVVNNYLILGLFFYLILTPMGVLLRLFGRDPLGLKPDRTAASYFRPVRRQLDPETLSDLF